MNRIALSLIACLVSAPASAALISQTPNSFTFSQGQSYASGYTAAGNPWSISYNTGERVDVLWWTPCSPCGFDDGLGSPLAPISPPPATDIPQIPDLPFLPILSPPSVPDLPPPLSTVPLPPSILLFGAAIAVFGGIGFARVSPERTVRGQDQDGRGSRD